MTGFSAPTGPATERYHARNHGPRRRSRIPLVTNLLRHPELLRYYLDTQVEDLQDLLFADDGVDTDVQRRSFELRKSLVALRRVVLPMREVLNTLMRRDLHLVDTEMTPYYQDVYDHVLRASEWTESLRDLVSTVLETRLTIQGNRLNEIMKKLTSWAAIIAIPTAVTGFYGQNVPYPGFQQVGGFISSIVLILGLGIGLYLLFKHKGWL